MTSYETFMLGWACGGVVTFLLACLFWPKERER